MKELVILGAGTAGTMMLNKLNNVLDKNEWQITIVDQHETHYAVREFQGMITMRDETCTHAKQRLTCFT